MQGLLVDDSAPAHAVEWGARGGGGGGALVAVAGSSGAAYVVDAPRGEAGARILRALPAHNNIIYAVAWADGGGGGGSGGSGGACRRLYTASGDLTAALSDVETGAQLARLRGGHASSVKHVAVARDSGGGGGGGEVVVTASRDGAFCLWDVRAPRAPAAQWWLQQAGGGGGGARRSRGSASGSGADHGSSSDGGGAGRSSGGGAGSDGSGSRSNGGSGRNASLYFFRQNEAHEQHGGRLLGPSLTAAAWLGDGHSFVTGSAAGCVRVWDLRCVRARAAAEDWGARSSVAALSGGGSGGGRGRGGVSSLDVSEDGTRLLVATASGSIAVHDTRRCFAAVAAQPVAALQLPAAATTALACRTGSNGFFIKARISSDGAMVLSGGADGCAYIWDLSRCGGSSSSTGRTSWGGGSGGGACTAPPPPPLRLRGHDGEVTGVSWCAATEEPRCATVSDDCTLRLWTLPAAAARRQQRQRQPRDLLEGYAERWAECEDGDEAGGDSSSGASSSSGDDCDAAPRGTGRAPARQRTLAQLWGGGAARPAAVEQVA
ncbi:WD40-repeat-containing domain protein [Tribonema minus]|uniref:WD40-repeat-containing domain protein n=1 Tax=Tribonema minus TaxID=303371 RepID=A0A835Z0X6_9STRA|nr:WD40-repeat-containing domain protein [Tribonema minus]